MRLYTVATGGSVREVGNRMTQTKYHTVAVFGKYHLQGYEESAARALEQLGVNVIRIVSGEASWSGVVGRFQRLTGIGPGVERLNQKLLVGVEKTKPDITLVYNCRHLTSSTLRRLAKTTFLAGYTNDNPFGAFSWRPSWRKMRRAIPYYDAWHVYRQSNVDDFQTAGAKRVNILMSYYLPWDITKEVLRSRKSFTYDVVFVGHGESDGRSKYVCALLDAGIRLRIYGYAKHWHRCLRRRDLARLPDIKPVWDSEYRDLIRKSKICLVFLSGGNRDEYTRRCFEIPSWGGFMLAERTPTLRRLYEEGREAEYFGSPDELVEKCRAYLAHDDAREAIAMCGQKKCLGGGHDIVSRMKQWLVDIEAGVHSAGRRAPHSGSGCVALLEGASNDLKSHSGDKNKCEETTARRWIC